MTKNITTRIQRRDLNGPHTAVYIKVTALDVEIRDAHQFLWPASLNTNYTKNNFYKIKPFCILFLCNITWDSSVDKAAGYRLDGRGSIPERDKSSPPPSVSRPALGPTQPPIQWVLGNLFTG
jgi:hypothetical protein